MSFDSAFLFTIKNEGGYSNHPDDRGGMTNFGITEITYSKWICRPAKEEDIRAITEEEAKMIYKAWYWNAMGLDKITDEKISTILFDLCVNCGQRNAVEIVQKALTIHADGAMGPFTIQAINKYKPSTLSRKICAQAMIYYASIIDVSPSQESFIRGWTNRVIKMLNFCNA